MKALTIVAIAVFCFVLGFHAGYFVGKAVQRHVNQRVENNLFVPVTTNDVVLETNTPTLPDGYWLHVSNDGLWRWESAMAETHFTYDTKEKCIEAARDFDNHMRAAAKRTWTEVK